MSVRDLSELTPEVRAKIESYIDRLADGFCGISQTLAEDTLDETRSHFLEALDSGSTLDDVRPVMDELGEPDEYAAAMCAEVNRKVGPDIEGDLATPAGKVFGMPYDAKAPTAENLRTRMWNPYDPRVFTPKLVGIGWNINFAALAVKMGIVRPDDEDEPFACVPERYIWAALAIPVFIAAGLMAVVALSWATLPDQLAIHWGIDGQPDGWASPVAAFLPILALTVLPSMYALWMSLSGRSNAARVMTTAFAMIFAVIGGGLVSAIFADVQGVQLGAGWPWFMIATAVMMPFIMLVVLSRLGREGEIRRDLDK